VAALYDHYGDIETAAFHYTGLQGWVNFLSSQVADTGYANMYYHYGDWVQPPPFPVTNQSLTSVASYAIDVQNLAELAGALGMNADRDYYNALYGTIGAEFHNAFYDKNNNWYVGPTLTAQVLAMAINAVPHSLKPAIMNQIVQMINYNGIHSSCGVLGNKYLYPVLSENGQHNLALKLATQITYPSLGFMFNNGWENATTLWEIPNAPFAGPYMNSRNHIMAGSIGAWFYRYVAGIKPNGLEEIEISPAPVGPDSPVNRTTARYNSIKGIIAVDWEKKT
jgi:alpha-L-rhamnosidase